MQKLTQLERLDLGSNEFTEVVSFCQSVCRCPGLSTSLVMTSPPAPFSSPFSFSFLKCKFCICFIKSTNTCEALSLHLLILTNYSWMNALRHDSCLACLWVNLLSLPSRLVHTPSPSHADTSLSFNLLSPLCFYSLRCWSSWLESRSCGWTGTNWHFYLGYTLQSFPYQYVQCLRCPKTLSWNYFSLISLGQRPLYSFVVLCLLCYIFHSDDQLVCNWVIIIAWGLLPAFQQHPL